MKPEIVRFASDDESQESWRAAAGGDRQALERLLREVQDLIFRFCRSRLRDQELAVDATQETALRLVKSIGNYQGHGKLTTWVLGIANNVCREFRRGKMKWTQIDLDFEIESGSDKDAPEFLADQENQGRLRGLVGRLPDRQREAIELRYFEEQSLNEVAKIMQVSLGTVKATINQAMKKLKLESNR